MNEDPNCTPSVRRTVLHRGARFDYVQASFAGTDGLEVARQYIRHPGAVAIVPVLEPDDGPRSVVLIRNYRVSLGTTIWEIPAGTLGANEDPGMCAARELLEETGYRADHLEALGAFYTSPGLSDELMHVYCGRALHFEGRRPEPDERMSVHPTPVDAMWRMIDRGDFRDAKSIAALQLAARRALV